MMPGWDRIYPDKRIITLILDPFEADELLGQALAEGRRIGERTIMGMPMVAFGDGRQDDQDAPKARSTGPVDPSDLDSWRSLGRTIDHDRDQAPVLTVKANPGASPETMAAIVSMAEMAATQLDARPEKRPASPTMPDDKVVILPVIRREPLPEKPAEPLTPARPAGAVQQDISAWSPPGSNTVRLQPGSSRRSILDEPPPVSPAEPAAEPSRRFNKAKNRWESRGKVTATDRDLIDQAIAQGRVTKCPDYKHSVEPGQLLPGEGWKKGKKKGKGK